MRRQELNSRNRLGGSLAAWNEFTHCPSCRHTRSSLVAPDYSGSCPTGSVCLTHLARFLVALGETPATSIPMGRFAW